MSPIVINGSRHVQRVRFIDPHLSWKPPQSHPGKKPKSQLEPERIQRCRQLDSTSGRRLLTLLDASEIPRKNHPPFGCIKNWKTWDFNYQPQLDISPDFSHQQYVTTGASRLMVNLVLEPPSTWRTLPLEFCVCVCTCLLQYTSIKYIKSYE